MIRSPILIALCLAIAACTDPDDPCGCEDACSAGPTPPATGVVGACIAGCKASCGASTTGGAK